MNNENEYYPREFPVARLASFFVLLAIIGVLGFVFIRVMAGFWLPLFLAALLVVIFRPLHQWILDSCEGKQQRAAILTTLAILLAVLGPLVWVCIIAADEAQGLLSRNWEQDFSNLRARTTGFRDKAHLDLPHATLIGEIDADLALLRNDLDEDDASSPSPPLAKPPFRTTLRAIESLRKELEESITLNIEQSLAAKSNSKSNSNSQIDGDSKDSTSDFADFLQYTKDLYSKTADYDSTAEVTDALSEPLAEFKAPEQRAGESDSNYQNRAAHAKKLQLICTIGDLAAARHRKQLKAQNSANPNSELDALAYLILTHEHIRAAQKANRNRDSPEPDTTSLTSPRASGEWYSEYRAEVAKGAETFRQVKTGVWGGPVWAWLRSVANPTPHRLKAWHARAINYIQGSVVSLTGQTTAIVASFAFGLFILVISLYYFLIDGPRLIRSAMRLSPLDNKYEQELFAEFANVSRAVVLATLLSAVVQAILAGIGYWAVGAQPLFLLTIVTGLLAMVPFVGAAAVWLPVALWVMFLQQHVAMVDGQHVLESGRLIAGIVLAVYGTLVVSMADNLIKPWVLHGQSNLHPLLALLSVLGGVKTLGPIGLLVGPMVVSFLQALLSMLNKELGETDINQGPDAGLAGSP